jgi:hypothetical protein
MLDREGFRPNVGIVLLMVAVITWLFGFDVLYALQDEAFDRSEGLRSVPARFGARRSMVLAAVAHVVTYGTPAVGGPTYTLGAREWGAEVCARDAAAAAQRDATDPIRVPITAVLSRRDRVVAWPACVDRTSLDVVHVEVGSSHLGMGLDPHVWATVAAAVEGRRPGRPVTA